MNTKTTFENPEVGKGNELLINGEDVKEVFLAFSTRNGKVTKDIVARRIWAKHKLPMYRGTIVEEVPFTLKIDVILFNFKEYRVKVVYHFVGD